MTSRPILYFALGVVACVGVAWALVAVVKDRRGPVTASAPADAVPGEVSVAGAELGGPFTLTDHTGRRVSDTDFRGRFLLIYFGYAYCPDVCPTELQAIARAIDLLGPAADRVVPVFITVDPARDDVAHMAEYVRAFHPRMVGLTGSEAEIAAVAKAYKVYHRKAPGTAPGARDYLVDHTSFIYLVGPDGKVVTLFRGGTAPEAVAAAVRARLG